MAYLLAVKLGKKSSESPLKAWNQAGFDLKSDLHLDYHLRLPGGSHHIYCSFVWDLPVMIKILWRILVLSARGSHLPLNHLGSHLPLNEGG